MPNVPPWPALMVSRGITKRTKLTVESTVGTVTDHPANVHGLYSTLGIDTGAPLNSLATYDDLGNLLPFEVEQFDGTNIVVHWKDTYASADADRYLYWDPTVDPGSSLANPTAVFGTCLIRHGLGTSLLDSTSNDHDGTNNGTDVVTGQIGNGRDFEASEADYIAFGEGPILPYNGLGISCWLKPETPSGVQMLADDWNAANAGYSFRLDGSILYFEYLQDAGHMSYRQTTAVVIVGIWQHVAVTLDIARVITFYINGVSVAMGAQTNVNLLTGNYSAAATLYSGGRANSYNLDGILDELRMFGTGISASHWLAETLFGLGTAVTVGGVETYQAGRALFLDSTLWAGIPMFRKTNL